MTKEESIELMSKIKVNSNKNERIVFTSSESKPCFMCGELTNQVDISHARICSDECNHKFNVFVASKEQ